MIGETIQWLNFSVPADNSIRKNFGKKDKIDARFAREPGGRANDIMKTLGFAKILEMIMLITNWAEDVYTEIAK